MSVELNFEKAYEEMQAERESAGVAPLSLAESDDPAAAPDPYERVYDDMVAQRDARARASIRLAQAYNPDESAQALELSRKTGVPVDIVRSRMQSVMQRHEASRHDLARMREQTPELYKALTRPDFIRAAHDDVDNLAAVERWGKGIVWNLATGATSGLGSWVWDAGGLLADTIAQVVDPIAGEDWFGRIAAQNRRFADRAREAALELGPQPQSETEQAFMSGVSSAGTNLALFGVGVYGMAAKGLTAAQAATLSAGAMSGGVAAQETSEARQQGLGYLRSLGYGTTQGMIEYLTEQIPAGRLFKALEGGGGFWRTMAEQQITEQFGEQAATFFQDLNGWVTLNPEKTLGDFLAERPDAAYQTMIATIAGTAMQTGGVAGAMAIADHITGRDRKQQESEEYARRLADGMKLIAASKLAQRSPATLEGFIDQVTKAEGEQATVFVDAEVLHQSMTENPEEFARALPSAAAQLQSPGALPGGMVAVPVGELARVAGTPLAQVIVENGKATPNARSLAETKAGAEEAEALMSAEFERVKQQASDQEAFQASTDVVRQQLREQFMGTNRVSKDVADAVADLYSRAYAVLAQAEGMTPEALYARKTLKAQGTPLVGEDALAQNPDSPEFRAWFGDSKVVDESGKPLVVYHGTHEGSISVFKGKRGVAGHFAFSPDVAFGYPNSAARADENDRSEVIYPAYLQATKIFDARNPDHLKAVKSTTSQWNYRDLEENADKIKNAGFDSYYDYETRLSDKPEGIAVFRPEQIKSVHNRGTFDPIDPNILRQSARVATGQDEFADEGDDSENERRPIEQAEVPPSVDDAAAMSTSLRTAASRVWNKGRDLKVAIQEAVLAAAQAAGVDVSVESQQSEDYLVRVATRDALDALKQNANAVGWYDIKTRQALAVMALVHPELATDENARMAFVWIMAVTSNGLKVGQNFELAESVYRQYKATGRMPNNAGIGTARAAINKSLVLFDTLKEAWGIDDLRRFMLTDFTVKEVGSLYPDRKPGGEHADVVVRGSAILGPKIGNGFFANLYGSFSSLTMDRWLIRTWGRWTGTLIKYMPKHTADARARVSKAALAVTRNPATRDAFTEILGKAITADMDPDVLAVSIQEASMDPALRERMNETDAGSELRLAGNGLAKYLDGQKEAPQGPWERKFIRRVFSRVLEDLREMPGYENLTMADLQAVLWYAEKRLYEIAKFEPDDSDEEGYADDEAPDYANAAVEVARAAGISKRKIDNALKREEANGRAADPRSDDAAAAQAAEEKRRESAGFTRGSRRAWLGKRAILRARSNRGGDEGSSWSYRRASRKDGKPFRILKLGVTGVDNWTIGTRLGNALKLAGYSAPKFVELQQNSAQNAAVFANTIRRFASADKFGAAVYVYDESEYQNMRLFLSEDGASGFALKPDGDIVSVFSDGGAGRAIMELAIAAGGRKLNCFDTILPQFYAAHGFRAVSRVSWSEKYKPEDWDKDVFGAFNAGEPDVVYMVYDPNYLSGDYSKADGARQRTARVAAAAQVDALQSALSGEYQQTEDDVPRGTFSPSAFVVTLTENADLTTLHHETAHAFLEILADLAARPEASERVREMMSSTLKWFGVPDLAAWQAMTLEQKRPHHEKFAEGWEAYVFEGKAPIPELQQLMGRFREWMKSVYKSMQRFFAGKGWRLDPEIRSVYDRIIASDEAIAASEARAGLTPDEEATAQAQEALTARSLADLAWTRAARAKVLRGLQKDAAAKRKAAREEAEAEIMATPVAQARKALRENKMPEEVLPGVPASTLAEVMAERLGFTSADHMYTALAFAPSEQEMIEALTDRKMLERYGDITSAAALERAADEAIHNEARQRAIASELVAQENALSGRTDVGKTRKGRRITVNSALYAAQQFAGNVVSGQAIGGLKRAAQLHRASAAKAAGEWLKAMTGRGRKKGEARGGTAEAIAAKRNQLLHHTTAAALMDAERQVERWLRYLKKFDSAGVRQKIDKTQLDQIDALLERLDLRKSVSMAEVARRQSLAAWVAEQQAQGIEPVIPDYLLANAALRSYKQMTVEEMQGLVDAIKNIEHIGKLKHKLLTVQEKRRFEQLVADIADSIRDNGGKIKEIPEEGKSRAAKWRDEFRAWHRKFASYVRQMDGNDENGILWRILGRGMADRTTAEETRIADETARLMELMAPILKLPGGITGDKRLIKSRGVSLSRSGRLAVALNWGRAENRQRLMDGNGYTVEQVNEVLSMLTAAELQFVQSVWDRFDSYWPEIKAKQERVTGLSEEKSPRAPFVVMSADGVTVEMAGGYYPVKYDTDKSPRQGAHSEAEVAEKMKRGAYTSQTTRRSFTKAILEKVNEPVRLDLDGIAEHIGEVIHDLTWHEWLIDATRILGNDTVMNAINDHYGPEVLRSLNNQLTAIAGGDMGKQTPALKAQRWLAKNVSRSVMGVSLTTALLQPFGLAQSMVRIGVRPVLAGAARWAGDAARFQSSMRWIREKSPFMRLRAQTANRELHEVAQRLRGKSKAAAVMDWALFILMRKMQMVADVPTWIGRYEQARAQGMSEPDAIAQADRAVREGQGSGSNADLANVQRDAPALSMFYSYFNATLNLSIEQTAATDFRKPAAVAGWIADMALLWVIPAILPALVLAALRGEGADDEPEEWAARLAKWQASYLLASVVGVRELSGAVQGFDYAGPPVLRIVGDAGKFGAQVAQGDVDEAAVMAAGRLVGDATGMPMTQLMRMYRGWEAWQDGDAPPTSVLFGPPPKD